MARKPKKNSKAQFIRSVSIDLDVDEVIAKAAEAGLKITKGYIQTTRSEMRKLDKAKAKAQPQLSLVIGGAGDEELQLRRMMVDLGLRKCKSVLAELEVVAGGAR